MLLLHHAAGELKTTGLRAIRAYFRADTDMPSSSGLLRWFPPVAALACLLTLHVGCTLDFDQFNTGEAPGDTAFTDGGLDASDAQSPETGPDDVEPTDADASDIQMPDGTTSDADALSDADGTSPALTIGASCSNDGQCGSGVCIGGYCTKSCQTGGNSCPGGSACTPLQGERFCLLTCDALDQCPNVDGRQLSCLSVSGAPTLDTPASRPNRCLNDSDQDNIFDGVDNCPMTANGPQDDQNKDGVGDACSSNSASCPTDVPGGLRAYPVLATSVSNPSIPSTTTSRWIPIVGGETGAMQPPANTVHHVDRRDGSSRTQTSLPYGLTGQVLMDIPGSQGHVGTPGSTLRRNGAQFGRFLEISTTGEVDLGPQYALDAEHVQMTMTGAGIPVAHGYSGGGWHIWRWQNSTNSFGRITSAATSTGTGDRTWRAVRRLDGDVTFYNYPDDQATGDFNMRIATVDPHATSVTTQGPVTLPADASQTSNDAFHPALFPGPGDQLYAIDIRGDARGRIARLNLSDGTATPLAPLTFGLDINATAVSVDPTGPSVFLIGDAPGQDNQNFLFIREVYPGCLMGVPQIDDDGDATPDLQDNCPGTSNSAQADADQDRIGDTCDPDDDNDGVLDTNDLVNQMAGGTDVSADTDNDTKPNRNDMDDDGDGIPDVRDRLPLDTDNDWVQNNLDTDDDGDGYSDASESSAGTDLLEPTSFPGAGTVAYIHQTQSGDRTARLAPLTDAASSTTVLDASHNPHQPRLFNGSNGLIAISGAPGSATEFVRSIRSSGSWGSAQIVSSSSPILDYDTGDVVSLGSDLADWFAIRDTGGSSTTNPVISKFSTTAGSFSTLVDTFDVLPVLSADATGPIQFVAGAARCPGCLAFYTTDTSGSAIDQHEPTDFQPLSLRRNAGWTTMLAPTPSSQPPDVLRRPTDSGQSFRTVATPTVADIHDAISIADNHLLLSATRQSGSYDLWLYNARIGEWFRLTNSSADILGLDWTN